LAKFLILGRGKTGAAVAEAARARGHNVQVLTAADNAGGTALTSTLLASIDVVIDFTTPAAVRDNLRALLPLGASVVVGTTGWYADLPVLQTLAHNSGARMLHGTNFSLGVQAFFRAARLLAEALPTYSLAIDETHHATKKDAPSGTALTLKHVVEQVSQQPAQIASHREGDAAGLHLLTLRSGFETITLQHEASSRAGFAQGAVLAAEWLIQQADPGVWDFSEVATQLRQD
jgi:4-hydroxy-tetrahydrodipicolinate reductase